MDAQKVFGYMDSLKAKDEAITQDENFKNSMDYKYNCLGKAKDDAYNQCLSRVFEKFYLNAIPLNDEYKTAYNAELKNDIDAFAKDRNSTDLAYYVNEAMKRGSVPAKQISESVTKLVDETFKDRELNIKNVKPEELVFKMDDATDKKIDLISQNLELDDLASIISDNVKNTAASEIMRAKREKDNSKQLEKELSDDLNIQNESAIDFALEFKGINQKGFYQPSLFEGIMVGKINHASVMKESGELDGRFMYNVMDEYGLQREDNEYATVESEAFVESVREYTLLNISKALKLEPYTLPKVREMAQEYARR